MQPPHGQNPLRPLAIAGAPANAAELQQFLQLMNQQQQGSQGRSAFSTLPPQANQATLLGLPGANLPGGLQAAGLPNAALPLGADSAGRSTGPARSGSRNERSTTAYASRHQAAEQRRRNRINDRLDLLRRVVPHTERANTATFLEEVIRYVGELQKQITALETSQGLPLSNPPRQGIIEALADLSKPSQKVLNVSQAQEASQPVMSNLSQPFSLFPDSNINTSNAAQSTLPKDRPHTPSQSSGEVEGGADDKANVNVTANPAEPPIKRQRS